MVLRLTVEDQGPNLMFLRNLAFYLDLAIIAGRFADHMV
jgi:hypothetical protein